MKKVKETLCLVAAVIATMFYAGCSKETLKSAKQGEVSISFTSSALKSGSDLPASAIRLSIADANGDAVYKDTILTLYKFGSSYTANSIKLKEGKYAITSFIVLDEKNTVLYVAPTAGSKKAGLVKQPLPIYFAVAADQTTTVSPEVVKPEGLPSDYGYVNFGFTVVDEQQETICLNVGTMAKCVFENAYVVVSTESDTVSVPFKSSIVSVKIKKSTKGYLVRLIYPLNSDGGVSKCGCSSKNDGIWVSADLASKYTCESSQFIEVLQPTYPNDSICVLMGSYEKRMWTPHTITISTENNTFTYTYNGGLLQVKIPQSAAGYKFYVVDQGGNHEAVSYYLTASEISQYSCDGTNPLSVYGPVVVSSFFESLVYQITGKGHVITFTKDGGISSNAMNTLLPIIMSKEDKSSLDAILKASNAYSIKESEIQCAMVFPDEGEMVSIVGTTTKNSYRPWYTGGCGMSADAKAINEEIKRLVKKYMGDILDKDLTPDPVSDYSIKVGESFTLSLKSNASTGYQWVMTSETNKTILSSSKVYTQTTSGIGAPGTETWTFTGIAPGTTTVQLEYQRTFEAGSTIEKKSFTVTVH